MNIGFIGTGNMGRAIIEGIFSSGLDDVEVFAYNPTKIKVIDIQRHNPVTRCETAGEVVKKSDFVIYAVKPNVLENSLNETKEYITKDKIVVSIAAGKKIEFIENIIGNDKKTVRVMPNINALVSESCSAYCANGNVTKDEKDEIEKIFSCVGEITELSENKFPVFGVIGGSSPAFVYLFINSLAQAGVRYGLSKAEALDFAAQATLGSAEMILNSTSHPGELIDKVCSPGGTTIEGVVKLKEDGFEKAIQDAVKAAVEKDKKL